VVDTVEHIIKQVQGIEHGHLVRRLARCDRKERPGHVAHRVDLIGHGAAVTGIASTRRSRPLHAAVAGRDTIVSLVILEPHREPVGQLSVGVDPYADQVSLKLSYWKPRSPYFSVAYFLIRLNSLSGPVPLERPSPY
jgi:hypothetical protein